MFTWICPKCGREVPPAYTDCPDCAPQSVAASAPAVPEAERAIGRRPIWQPAPPTPPAPPPGPPPVAPPPPEQQQRYAPPPAPVRTPLPTWLMAVLFALVLGGLVWGVYWLVGSSHGSGASQTTPDASLAIPAAAPDGKANPYQKYVEISGIRFAEDPKDKDKSVVKFVITNHSDADVAGLSGNVAIVARGEKAGGQALAAFVFTTSLGPQESKDLTTALTTKLKPYELPDWQFAQPVLQIIAPGGASGGSR